MTRSSPDQYLAGYLYNGYDYIHQAWVLAGRYVACNHPETMNCNCYGTEHAGSACLERDPSESGSAGAPEAFDK